MNYRIMIKLLGWTLLCEAGLLMLPCLVAVIYSESVIPYILTALIAASVGFLCTRVRTKTKTFFALEGFLVVALSWILLSVIGCLPFIISGSIPYFADALFETVSGFTTTGASIITDLTLFGKAELFWRSFTHWIGGMGVLVFMLAVMPSVSDGHPMYLMRAEVPGPTVGKLVPTIRKTARILYIIYIALTALQVIMLLFGNMSFYDALIHAFGTAGTGGFSNQANSVAHYSPYVQYVIAVFMLIFATNFNLYYLILFRSFKSAIKDEEARWFYGITIAATVLIAINIFSIYGSIEESGRLAFFQVSSLISSTGYSTADFSSWPEFSRWMLMLMIFLGACAGSTGGGLKISRFVVILKSLANEVKHLLHPRSVNTITLNKRPVNSETLRSIYVFFAYEILILFGVTLILTLDGFDTTTSFTASLTCFSNAGPGLNAVGPLGNYSDFSALSKITMCFSMLLGRLEIFPMIILFSPHAWKR